MLVALNHMVVEYLRHLMVVALKHLMVVALYQFDGCSFETTAITESWRMSTTDEQLPHSIIRFVVPAAPQVGVQFVEFML